MLSGDFESYNSPSPVTPVLRATGLTKRFGRVEALAGVDVEVRPGEVVGLVGDNGAGKSTLVKCLAGVHQPDDGVIEVAAEPVSVGSPVDARRLGIETVFQDLALAPDLTVAANIFLGRELRRPGVLGRFGVLDLKTMRERSGRFLHDIGVTTLGSVESPADDLSGGQRQALAIARARAWASRVLLLDEPTAALGVRQRGIVLDIIRTSRAQGMAILFIAHDLPALFEVTDRMVVLRQGRVTANLVTAEATREDVVTAMLGAAA